MSESIDEEGGCPVDPTPHSAQKVLPDPWRVHVVSELLLELAFVEPDVYRVLRQVSIAKHVLMVEERVMHLPEEPLRRRGFGGLSRMLRMRMNLGKREVSEDEAQTSTELLLNLFDNRIGAPAVRTLVIAGTRRV